MAASRSDSRKRKPTVSLAEIADEAGVSKMTASRVLRGGTGFSSETRDRVLEVARRLGYVPNRIAAAFGSDASNTLIGIALPTLSRDLYGQILEGLETKLSSVGYQPMVGVVGYDDDVEHHWLNSALAWRPSGIVIAGRERGTENRRLLRSLDIPVVEMWNLGRTPASQRKSDPLKVGFDHYQVGWQMGQYLAGRYSGAVGYVGVRADDQILGADRLQGFQDALSEHRGNDDRPVITQFLNDKSSFYAGYYGTEQILSAHPDIRVLYYLDDNMAVGGLMLCQQKGFKIPGDVAIAGFGGMDIGSVLPARLTSTSSYRLKIGKLAAENLIKRIGGNPVSVVQDVGFDLIKGETA